ncbi:methyltransferase domain-containing protein [Solidesulfovibrio carbinolicus]|uniref:Arsenite methyltransferase n=1 Tax=Solidesulfovibrio carbinolicus TaxID=296842 RepID=A0A4P6HPJ3_9BACT|nr:methyltransferase domain-containing protein [Solidesulfovibrio carbinolicus]QAZ69223.1 methyltransferase type 11 [Solidesulfovibrio carbinolicus]
MENDALRAAISTAYAKALEAASQGGGGGCCGGSGCCGAGGGTLIELAGYGPEREQHVQAAATSFGCGNPLAFSGVEPGQTVLDLGSGAGFDLLIAADRVGPTGKVVGVDMTEAMLAAARENIARAGLDSVIEVRQGHIEALPVADASVDWVISNCVINLSTDKAAVFAEIFRVLRPGGRIAISDIVAEDLPPAVLASVAGHAACVSGAISEAAYLAGLAGAGLVDVAAPERLVYSAEQLRALFGEALSETLESLGGVDFADVVAGKVASLRFVGRKPG